MRMLAALGAIAAIALLAVGISEIGLWGSDEGDPDEREPRITGGSSDIKRVAPNGAPSHQTEPRRATAGAAGVGSGRLPDRVPDPSLSGSACERLAEVATQLGEETEDPQEFVRRLGREAAGIHPGARALLDLARGGTDILVGGGFRAAFSDGTSGQARHFAGIAVAASYGGEEATRTISIFVRRDPPSSADGRLTEEALAFERALRRGELATAAAGAWILSRICRASGS